MSFFRWIFLSIFHDWKINLTLILSIATATAILLGALWMGDSMRGSLEILSLNRLGNIDGMLVFPNGISPQTEKTFFSNKTDEKNESGQNIESNNQSSIFNHSDISGYPDVSIYPSNPNRSDPQKGNFDKTRLNSSKTESMGMNNPPIFEKIMKTVKLSGTLERIADDYSDTEITKNKNTEKEIAAPQGKNQQITVTVWGIDDFFWENRLSSPDHSSCSKSSFSSTSEQNQTVSYSNEIQKSSSKNMNVSSINQDLSSINSESFLIPSNKKPTLENSNLSDQNHLALNSEYPLNLQDFSKYPKSSLLSKKPSEWGKNEIVLNRAVADKLGIEKPGVELNLWLPIQSVVPAESALGNKDDRTIRRRVRVQAILEKNVWPDSWSISSNQEVPLSVFLPLKSLENRTDEKSPPCFLLFSEDNSSIKTNTFFSKDFWIKYSLLDVLFSEKSNKFLTNQTDKVQDFWKNSFRPSLDDIGLTLDVFSENSDKNRTSDNKIFHLKSNSLLISKKQSDELNKILRNSVDSIFLQSNILSAGSDSSGQTFSDIPDLSNSASNSAQIKTQRPDFSLKKEPKNTVILPIFVYLADSIQKNSSELSISEISDSANFDSNPDFDHQKPLPILETPYSTVAGIDLEQDLPTGLFLKKDGSSLQRFNDNEIVLNEWTANDLNVQIGDQILLRWLAPETFYGQHRWEEKSFRLAAVVRMQGLAVDPLLTPELKGITDADSMNNWNPPFPFDAKRVRKKDEDYWTQFRTAPKAFLTLKTAQSIWKNRFGTVSAFCIIPPSTASPFFEQNKIDTSNFDNVQSDNHLEEKSLLENSPPKKDLTKNNSPDDVVPSNSAPSYLQNSDRFYLQKLEKELTAKIQPETFGLVLIPLREKALRTAAGTTPFDILFLCFSLFLIMSALLLLFLLLKVSWERKKNQQKLLELIGFSPNKITCLFLCEFGFLIIPGLFLGILLGYFYARLLIDALNSVWIDAVAVPFLTLQTSGFSACLGIFLIFSVYCLCILGLRYKNLSVKNQNVQYQDIKKTSFFFNKIFKITSLLKIKSLTQHWGIFCFFAAVLLILFSFPLKNEQVKAGLFFGAGFLFLSSGLGLLFKMLQKRAKKEGLLTSLPKMAVKNLADSALETVLTVSLLSVSLFMVFSVGLFHLESPTLEQTMNDLKKIQKNMPVSDSLATNKNHKQKTAVSGREDGGFWFIGQTSLPFYFHLGTDSGRINSGFSSWDSRWLSEQNIQIFPLRTRQGDQIDCSNLYRSEKPKIIGLPDSFISHQENSITPFLWAAKPKKRIFDLKKGWKTELSKNNVSESFQKNNLFAENNPWTFLSLSFSKENRSYMPVILDQNTAMYSLHLYQGLGETFELTNEKGEIVSCIVVALLSNSIFQGEILTSEAHLLANFPEVSGFQMILADFDSQNSSLDLQKKNLGQNLSEQQKTLYDQTKNNQTASPQNHTFQTKNNQDFVRHFESILTSGLREYGFQGETSSERLARFFSVQNTYITAFQSLGGLGILLGTFGLALLQFRNVLRRQRELTLFLILGFSRKRLTGLLFLETSFLLLMGFILAFLASGFSLGPQIWTEITVKQHPVWTLIRPEFNCILLFLVAVIGLSSTFLALFQIMRLSPISALQDDSSQL